jgi:RHS repeat-associated protein
LYGFNGQEKDDEVAGSGNVYTATYWEYDSRLGRRWNTDPVVKSDASPYCTFSNSPIIMIDPKGDLDYYNQRGKKIGTNGYDDGRIAVVTDRNTIRVIKKAMRQIGDISINPNSTNIIELPSANVRARIGDAVDRSNSPTNDDTKGGFHEEGGIFGTDEKGKERVIDAKPGAYANPKVDKKATLKVFEAANPDEQGILTDVQGTFHVHPAGEIIESTGDDLSVSGQKTSTANFIQTPSAADVDGAGSIPINIVAGARDNTVYIYGRRDQNKSGTNYRATFPLDKFRKIGNEEKP